MSPDLLIAIGQVFLTGGALLMLANPVTHIHPALALLTAASLTLVTAGLFLLSAPVSGVVAAVAVVAWLGIFVFRGHPKSDRGGL